MIRMSTTQPQNLLVLQIGVEISLFSKKNNINATGLILTIVEIFAT